MAIPLQYDIFAKDRASNTFDRVGRSMDRANRSSRGFGRSFSAAGVAIGRAARATGLAVAAGTALATKSILTVGIAYQDTLNVFRAATGATRAEMAKVEKTATELGANLTLPATSAADAAAAMTELAKGGFSVRQSMAASLGTLQLSAAAQVSGAEAAQIQAAALNQFGLSAKSATKVADILANTANAAAGEITDMSLALSYVGPVADSFGISIADTAATIGLLAKGGILGEKAGTALRGALAGLANPSAKAAKALKVLKVDAFNANGQFKGMRPLIDGLAEAHKNLSQEEFNQAAAAAFGREPLAAINTLAAQGETAFDKMSAAVLRNGGAADLAAAKTKGLHGAWEGLKSQLETVAITIFNKIEPSMSALLKRLAAAVPDVVAFVTAFAKSDAVQQFADSVLPRLASAWSTVTQLFSDNRTTFSDLGTILTTKVLPALGPLTDAFGKAFQVAVATVFSLVKTLGVPAFRHLAGALERVAPAAESAATWLQKNSDIVAPLAATLVGYIAAIKVVRAVTWGWAAAQVAVNTAMLTNPYIAAAAAVTAVAAGMVYLNETTGRAHDAFIAFGKVCTAVVVVFGRALNFIITMSLERLADMFRVLDKISGGWIPGFDTPLAKVADRLDAAANKTREWDDAIAGLPDRIDIPATLTITTRVVNGVVPNSVTGTEMTPQQAAAQHTKDVIAARKRAADGAKSVTDSAAEAAKKAAAAAARAASAAGKALGDSLAGGIDSTAGTISKAAEKAMAAASDAVDKAKAKFDEIKAEFESLRDSVSSSISGWFELKTEGNPFAGLGSIAQKAVRFANALAKLAKQGVNPSVIAMIAQAGPDVGYRAAVMLSTAGKKNRRMVNNAYERIDAAANRAGNIVGNAMYGEQLGVARSQLNELTQIRKAVTRKHKANALNAGWSAA